MKRKLNKLPLIILLVAGIVLSGTAVLALNNDIPSFTHFMDKDSEIFTTPPMLEENTDQENSIDKEDSLLSENSDSKILTETDFHTLDSETTAEEIDETETDKSKSENTEDAQNENINAEPTEKDDELKSEKNNEEIIEDDDTIIINEEDADASLEDILTGDSAKIPMAALSETAEVKDNTTAAKESENNTAAAESKTPAKSRTVDSSAAALSSGAEVQPTVSATEKAAVQNGSANVLVINPSYAPISGAVVSISGGSATVNSSGWGTINAAAGSYVYVASAPGYRASAGSLTITPNGTSSATVVLIPDTLAGLTPNTYSASFVLTNQIGTGEPVVNAVVETENNTTLSNAGGIAVLNNLSPGVYQVKIGGPDYYDTLITITITDADITQDVKLTKTESAIAASQAKPAVSQPTPAPASRPAADNSYKKPSGSSNSSNKNNASSSSNNNSSSNNSSNSNRDDEEKKVVLDEIKEGGNKGIGSAAGEDSEIIESGELTPQVSATPSPQPTKTPAPTPTPTPVTDTSTYTVSFNLMNLNGTSVAGMTVELHSEVMTAKTDTQGFVTFENVPEGEHNLFLINSSGDVTASKAFSINSGVQTELDIANVGGDKVYVGMGTDSITIDAVVDGSLMALTSVAEGTQPKAAPLIENEEQTSTQDNNLMWMLIISVSAAVIAVIILLLAIRKMKKTKAVDIHSNGGAAISSVDVKDVKKSKFKKR